MRRLALAALLAVAGGTARAEGPPTASPPRWGSLQLTVSTFQPNIDSGTFSGGGSIPTTTPYATVFGTSRPILIQALFSRSLWASTVGTLDLGLGLGYWHVSGSGIFNNSGTLETGSSTSLTILPVTAALGYRFDILFDQWGVPLEPYARAAFVDKVWWANGQNGTSTATVNGQSFTGMGATYGWSATLGVALVLDAFDPGLARQMTYDTGIAHTMLTFDFTKEDVNDFGSKTSWQLGPSYWMWSAGILFVF